MRLCSVDDNLNAMQVLLQCGYTLQQADLDCFDTAEKDMFVFKYGNRASRVLLFSERNKASDLLCTKNLELSNKLEETEQKLEERTTELVASKKRKADESAEELRAQTEVLMPVPTPLDVTYLWGAGQPFSLHTPVLEDATYSVPSNLLV